jgi:hypothetical protein
MVQILYRYNAEICTYNRRLGKCHIRNGFALSKPCCRSHERRVNTKLGRVGGVASLAEAIGTLCNRQNLRSVQPHVNLNNETLVHHTHQA